MQNGQEDILKVFLFMVAKRIGKDTINFWIFLSRLYQKSSTAKPVRLGTWNV